MNYIAPEYKKGGFTCPNCNIYSNQDWDELYSRKKGSLFISNCQHCENIGIWFTNIFLKLNTPYDTKNSPKLVFPKKSNIPLPNEDLEEEIKQDYLEASNILNDSARGACALLRLALQKLMIQLGEDGKKIDINIGNLVKKGLSITIQQALDSVRIIGNEAVHPGEIDLKDDIETATKIFGLINIIADALITQPKKIQELYGTLPQGKIEGIENRDK